MAEVDDRALGRAHKLRLRGLAEHNAGRPAQALLLFRRGITLVERAATGTLELQRRVLHTRLTVNAASSESELRGLDAGLAELTEVTRYLEHTSDPDVAVYLHLGVGYMRARGGQFEAGRQHLDEAVKLIGYADPAAQSNILMNRGMVHLFLGDIALARRDYTRAISVARDNGLRMEEAKLTHNLGEIEFYGGNLAAALALMDQSAQLNADVSVAVTLVDRAKVLLEAGLHRDADEALQEAGELFRKDRLFKDVGEVELARAECALLGGEILAARRLAASARNRFRRRHNDSWRRNAELVLLQADLAGGRPGGRIAVPAGRLATEFDELGLRGQARIARLIEAEARLDADQPELASAIVADLGSRPEDSISVRLHSRFVQASIAYRVGDQPAARWQARRGLTELSNYQARFGSIDMQTGSAIHGRRLAELDLQIALRSGRPSAALDAVERARASSSRLVPVRPPADDEVAALLGELRQVTDEVRNAENEAAAGPRLLDSRRRIAEIQRTLRSRAWSTRGSGAARRPAPVAEIRARLAGTGSVLVCFVQTGGQLSAIVESAGSARVQSLGSVTAVNEQIRRLRADLDVLSNGMLPAALADVVGRSFQRGLAALQLALIQPLDLPDQQLVIVPTGALAALAWNELPALRGRPVCVAPSATAWLAAGQPAERAGPLRVAAFAGPDLARARDEVKTIGETWGSATIRVEEAARPDDLVPALSEATIVHVAAHGQHQPENPLFSSIRLADGPVFAYELDQHPRAAEHVVLSACELGQATIRPGDEALGLTSVLLHLGSRSVISGVARVHDEVAADVMIRYHRALADGRDSAQALAEASASSTTLPAPFVCFGSSWQAR
ncbi:MAG: CHAT domain-containing protein [Jatrophihabitantaceae bacterium]